MTNKDDEQAKTFILPIDKTFPHEHTQVRQEIQETGTLLDIENLESDTPDKIREIIKKMCFTLDRLKDFQERFIGFYDFSPVGYVIISNQGIIHESNHTFATLIGNSIDSLINETLDSLVVTKDQRAYQLFQNRLFDTGEESVCELRIKTGDNASIWVCLKGKLYRNKKTGESAGLIVVNDINKYKQTEKTLKHDEEKYRSILDQSMEMLFLHDLEGNFLDVNKAAVEKTKYSEKELLGLNVFDIHSQKSDRDEILHLWKHWKPGQHMTVEDEHINKYRDIYPVEITTGKISIGERDYILAFVRDITKRKQAEAVIKEANQRVLTILNNLNAVVYVADMETYETIFVNRYVRDMFGNVVGKNCWSVMQSDQTGPCGFCTNQKLIDAQGNPTGIYRWEFKNTKTGKWYDCHDSAIKWIDGRTVRLEIAIDITERKQAEDALYHEYAFRNTIIDKVREGLCVCHAIGEYPFVKFTVWNDRMSEITGYTLSEINRLGWYQTLYPDFEVQNKAIERMKKMRQGEDLINEQWEINRADGNKRVLSISSSIVESNDGAVHVLALMQDVTDRKRYEDALKNAKKQWEETFDAITDWVCIIDKDCRIVRSNKASEKYFGLLPQDIIGRYCYEIVHGINAPISECPLQKAVKSRQREELEFQAENDRWWHVLVEPMESTRNKDSLLVHVVRDITESKIREQKIFVTRKAEAFRILAGGLAHDYNNLLTAIWGNISLLKSKITDAMQHEIIKETEKACETARLLTHKFLYLSKAAVLNKSECDMKEVLSTAVRNSLKTQKVTILFDCPSRLPVLAMDIEQMLIAFQNIIVNAVEAMPNGGKLIIRAEIEPTRHNDQKDADFLHIFFEDTGTGIPGSDLTKVFDPYFTTKAMGAQKGVGLGLAAAQAIVNRHGGNIQIESAAGTGTTVIVSLPYSTNITNI
ncbi:MAG: PAS domain S-box protein [Desulfobacterales bacterium]